MGQIVCLLPAALATVLFPRFAGSWHSLVEDEFRTVCTNAVRMALFLTLPLTCVCFVMRGPLVALLFQRGAFSPESGAAAAKLFGLLLLAAPAAVLYGYVQRMLYAVQETRAPAYAQLSGALLLFVVAPQAAARFGASGIAVLSVIAWWLMCSWLFFVFQRNYHALSCKELGLFGGKILLLAIGAAWLGDASSTILSHLLGASDFSLSLIFIGSVSLAILIFCVATLLLHFPEAIQGHRYLQWQEEVMVRKVQGTVGRSVRGKRA
jgi:putative peptidoglycan lipid II flippase